MRKMSGLAAGRLTPVVIRSVVGRASLSLGDVAVNRSPGPLAGSSEGARLVVEWARVELNYRPHAYQACALTT